MKPYATEITAINPLTGKITLFIGPNIRAESFEEAEKYCQLNGLGYCKVVGEFIEEIENEYNICLN